MSLHQFNSRKSKRALEAEPVPNEQKITAFYEAISCYAQDNFYCAYSRTSMPDELKLQILALYKYLGANTLDIFREKLTALFYECLQNPNLTKLGEQRGCLYLFALEIDIYQEQNYLVVATFRDLDYLNTPPLNNIDNPARVLEFIAFYDADDKKFNLSDSEDVFVNQILNPNVKAKDKRCSIQ